jgi:excinuclease UvrABC helicase subunit UvrB
MQEWDAQRHDAALKIVRATALKITALPDLEIETFQVERQRSLDALHELEKEITNSRPLSEIETMERDLRRAVEAQEFERAAALRDQLRVLRAQTG